MFSGDAEKEKAREEFERLRSLASEADLEMPVFQRLKPIAAKLAWPQDWRFPTAQKAGRGPAGGNQRTWDPSDGSLRRREWQLTSADGRPIVARLSPEASGVDLLSPSLDAFIASSN